MHAIISFCFKFDFQRLAHRPELNFFFFEFDQPACFSSFQTKKTKEKGNENENILFFGCVSSFFNLGGMSNETLASGTADEDDQPSAKKQRTEPEPWPVSALSRHAGCEKAHATRVNADGSCYVGFDFFFNVF